MAFYFDHNATTPVSAEVLDALVPMLTEQFGNASSIHGFGQAAKQKMEGARREVGALLGCDAKEVVYTSGGTEADNLALFGVVRRGGAAGKHVVTTAIEHPGVLSACTRLEYEGAVVTVVPVGVDGVVDPDEIRAALRPETVLISAMHANNETGALQPIQEIAKTAREAGVLFHCDGVQAAGRLPVNVRELGVDLYTISGHKFSAPKGVGALYVREGVKLEPMLFGGRHERERRAGTENVAGAVALGAAARWLLANVTAEGARLTALRDRLERGVLDRVPHPRLHAGAASRTPNTSNIAFAGIEAESMVIALDLAGFAVSTGAACSSGAVQPSHVLMAMGVPVAEAKSSVRFSLGRTNDEAQVEALIEAVAAAAARLRKLSPTYSHA
jgi:cysteine desulfurase